MNCGTTPLRNTCFVSWCAPAVEFVQTCDPCRISPTAEAKPVKKPLIHSVPPSPKQRPKDKVSSSGPSGTQSAPSFSWLHANADSPLLSPEQPLTTKSPSSSTLNCLSTPSTRGHTMSRVPCDGVHRIRVDFKRDHDVEKAWEAGGLSLLTSVPVTPRLLCFLCASSGNVEVNGISKVGG